jgi:hypothetical protein
LLVDDGDKQGARKEFLAAADEATKFPFAEWRNEMLVRSHNALGIIAWQEANFSEALRWLKMAEEEQTRAGGNWVPISPRTVNGLRESSLHRLRGRL